MFAERILTTVLSLPERSSLVIRLSTLFAVVLSPNLFTVKIAALTLALEIYCHFKMQEADLKNKIEIITLDCELLFQHKEKSLLERHPIDKTSPEYADERKKMTVMGELLGDAFPGMHYGLLVSNFETLGISSFISNTPGLDSQEVMIVLLRDVADGLEEKLKLKRKQ